MVREGTRSQTGSATPRVFHAIDTAPSIVRKKITKPATAKPTGVTKKKTPKKEPGPVARVKAAAKKVVEKAAAKVEKPKK